MMFTMLSILCQISAIFAAATPDVSLQENDLGVLQMPFKKLYGDPNRSEFSKRDDSEEMTLNSTGTYYVVDLEVGTPPQSMRMLVDTGSSDTWFDGDESKENHFAYQKSSTFKKNDTDQAFKIGYGDGSKASGFWASDKFTIFGQSFFGSFGLANKSTAASPILGLGLRQGELSVNKIDQNNVLSPTYPNFPELLKNNGLIKRVAYSLWLSEDASGSVLFGGVDHSKYDGNLTLVPIVNDHTIPVSKTPTSLSVLLHEASLSHSNDDFTSEIDEPVLLDSGSTMCQLPEPFVEKLGKALNGNYSSDAGVYEVDCSASGTVHFNLSGTSIPVDVEDLLVPMKAIHSDSKADSCALGIYKVEQGSSAKKILGDPFLRNAYVVYDLEGLQVGLAPARKHEKSEPQIEAISSGIPRATSASLYSHTSFSTATQSA